MIRRLPPLLLLLLVPILWFPGAIPGPRVVSADDHLSVHHAYGDPSEGRVRHPHLSDPALQLEPLRARVVAALQRGEAPLWNPDLYGGAPLLADAQSMPASPVTWLHALLPEDMAQDAGVALVLLATGLGAGLLAARLGAGPWGAAVAGAAAMTGPYTGVWLLHPHAATFCWLPWLLLGVDRRRAGEVALATVLMIGGGHPGTFVHGLAIAGIWWLWRGRSVAGLVGLFAGLLLAAPLLGPQVELALGSTTVAARGGQRLPPSALLDLLWPGWWGHPAADSWTGTGAWADAQLHPGLGALVLAGLSLWRPLGRRLVGAWALLVGLALIGLPGPFDHARLGEEAALLLALAAGLGAGRRLLPLAFGVVLLTGLHARRLDQGSLAPETHDPTPAAWVDSLRAQVGPGRVLGLDWALQPNTGSAVGLRDLRGYDLPVSTETQRLMAALNSRPQGPWYPVTVLPNRGLLAFGAVRVVLTLPQRGLPLVELPLEGASIRAWAVDLEAPRAWLATGATQVSSPEEAFRRLGVDPHPRRQPPVEGKVDLPAQGGEIVPVEVEDLGASALRLHAAPATAALLVLSEAWAPGWRAEVDGAPATILRVGGAFRGVVLAAGEHEVRMRYRPIGWIWGQRLFVVGALLLVAWGAGRRLRSTKSRSNWNGSDQPPLELDDSGPVATIAGP